VRLPLSVSIERRKLLARLLCRGDVTVLTLRADGRLGIGRADGSVAEAEVDASTAVFASLVVLRYRRAGRCESLVLPRVATGEVAHRRLRVWLRCRAKTGAAGFFSAAA